MRAAIVLAVVAVGCATGPTASAPTVPSPEPGRLSVVAQAGPRTGGTQPIAVAITNGRDQPLRLDPRQVFAISDGETRIASVDPAEAARMAGGARLPGAVRGGVVGAATGGALGAISGVIVGAIQGGIGTAAAAGAAAGAAIGAITGSFGGARQPEADVGGFTDRALPATTLAERFSATGYVYYPPGTYHALEVVLSDERSGSVVSERVVIEPGA